MHIQSVGGTEAEPSIIPLPEMKDSSVAAVQGAAPEPYGDELHHFLQRIMVEK